MENLYGRSVFFVEDAELALAFYMESLGFAFDWEHRDEGRLLVFQVSLFGLQLIFNATENGAEGRAGYGRVFVHLDHEQGVALCHHVKEKDIVATITYWGAPTLLVQDLDGNELYFWPPGGQLWELDVKEVKLVNVEA